MPSPDSEQKLSLPLKILGAFLVFYLARDILALGGMYGEARGILEIPLHEVNDFSKHPRESFFLKFYPMMAVLDVAMLFALFRKHWVFLWLFPIYFVLALSAPVINVIWFNQQYGHLLDETGRQHMFPATLGSVIATVLLVFPWVIYVLASGKVRAVFRVTTNSSGEQK